MKKADKTKNKPLWLKALELFLIALVLTLTALTIFFWDYISFVFKKDDCSKNFTEKNIVKIYDNDNLCRKESTFNGQKCVEFYIPHASEFYIDRVVVHLFKSSKSARKAFLGIKDSAFREIVDRGDDYIRGWRADIFDAEEEDYTFVTGNLVLTFKLDGYSEWPIYDNESVDFSVSYPSEENKLKLIEFVRNTFS